MISDGPESESGCEEEANGRIEGKIDSIVMVRIKKQDMDIFTRCTKYIKLLPQTKNNCFIN